MHLTLSPSRGLPGQTEAVLTVNGDRIIVNGILYDLSEVPEGGAAFAEGADDLFIGSVTRVYGVIHCTLRVVLGDDCELDQPADPGHWTLAEVEGPVSIPARRGKIGTEETAT